MENDNACSEDMAILMKEFIFDRCKSYYLPNEVSILNQHGENIISYECFLQKFEQMCAEFIWE